MKLFNQAYKDSLTDRENAILANLERLMGKKPGYLGRVEYNRGITPLFKIVKKDSKDKLQEE